MAILDRAEMSESPPRRRRGRPRLGVDRLSHVIAFRVEPAIVRQLERRQAAGEDPSQVARRLLLELLIATQ